MDLSHGPGKDRHNGPPGAASKEQLDQRERDAASKEQLDQREREREREREKEREKERLQELMQQLHAAIQNSQALAPFKDQLLLDITPEGLRIQIVDKLNRPMFDLGSAQLKDYTYAILGELGTFINRVPNHVSISGHTDDAPYAHEHDYSNWELSTDRANAARRALVAGGMLNGKTVRVLGLAASVPLDKAHPDNPINRRISIIVMTRQAEAAALSQDLAETIAPIAHPPAAAVGAPAPAAAGAGDVTSPARGAPGGTHEPVATATLPVPPTVRPASR